MGVAVDAWIADLNKNRTAEGDQPLVGDVDLFVAALNEIVAALPAQSNALQPVTGGRLTLVTGTPVLSADVTAITSVFFALYNGNQTLIYNGTAFVGTVHGELTQTLADNTKSPAAAAANSVYDMFVWDDAGTVRCTRGPVWTNATTRAMALARVNGILTNGAAITNGPAINRGTYVGTIATDATSDLNMMFAPAAAAGGAANRLDVWNMYNQQEFSSVNLDSTASWNYSTTTWRAKNNNANNGIIFVQGQPQIVKSLASMCTSSTNAQGLCVAWGLDSVAAPFGNSAINVIPSHVANKFASADYAMNPLIAEGRHVLTPLEISANTGTTTWQNNVAIAGTSSLCPARISLMM